MSINEVLTEKDLQEGLILTCVGYAETDLELNFWFVLIELIWFWLVF